MVADLRDALRQLRNAPGFTATALITLALGIGATTAIFTLIHQVMLKSLPVANPEELWKIGDKNRCCNWGGYTQGEEGDFSLFSWEAYKNFRAHTPEFTDLAALQAGNAALGVRRAGSQAAADTRNGEYVSGNFFRTFGVQPWIGRLLTDADDQESRGPGGGDELSHLKRGSMAPIPRYAERSSKSTDIRSPSWEWRRQASTGQSFREGACRISGCRSPPKC